MITMDQYYVYVLLDTTRPGIYKYSDLTFEYEPFYIGKGKNNRVSQSKSKNIGRIKNIEKSEIINKIHLNDLTVRSIKYIENINEDLALDLESLLIKKIGRSDKNNGPLVNKSYGGEGKSGGTTREGDWPELYKCVIKYSLSGEFISEYDSIKKATYENPKSCNISKCCHGHRDSSGGYVWRFKNNSMNIPIINLSERTQKGNTPSPVICKNMENEVLDHYASIKEASISTGCSPSKIVLVCQGKRKFTKGYKFEYKNANQ